MNTSVPDYALPAPMTNPFPPAWTHKPCLDSVLASQESAHPGPEIIGGKIWRRRRKGKEEEGGEEEYIYIYKEENSQYGNSLISY